MVEHSSCRTYSLFDRIIIHFTEEESGQPSIEPREYPAANIEESELSQQERTRSIQMMRVNHAGEVCAQALYEGQALLARCPTKREFLIQSGKEEIDHLNWCSQRLIELGGHTSYLSPVWYAGSLLIGICAAAAGDKVSLGFLAETEYQVTRHIDSHLEKMSYHDFRSRAVLNQMREDELKHATHALHHGGEQLPYWSRIVMTATSKVMTWTARYI